MDDIAGRLRRIGGIVLRLRSPALLARRILDHADGRWARANSQPEAWAISTAAARPLSVACTKIPGVSRSVSRTNTQLVRPMAPTTRASVTAPATVLTSYVWNRPNMTVETSAAG